VGLINLKQYGEMPVRWKRGTPSFPNAGTTVSPRGMKMREMEMCEL
jgi:hypothetical protein